MLLHPLVLVLTLAPSIVSAALYPKDSPVKMVDSKGLRNALKENVRGANPFTMVDSNTIQRTSVVAFVASWCGVSAYPHCQTQTRNKCIC
jgi:protein disulfide-isomerase A6